MWHPKIVSSLADFDLEEIPSSVPNCLPLLEEMRRSFPVIDRFADVDVLFIQHHLGPFIAKLKAFFLDGLAADRCWFVDIPYSTNSVVRDVLTSFGCPAAQSTQTYTDPLADYSLAQSWRVALLIQRLANRRNAKRLLVIDDGAYFARYLNTISAHQPDLLDAFIGTCIVEQTTRGHRYLWENESNLIGPCKLRVVSIARCHTKLEFEGPFIGAAVARALTRSLGEEQISNLKRIGVIGYGNVGKATVTALLKKVNPAAIDIVDNDEQVRNEVSRAGARCTPLTQLRNVGGYDLVVGCTGYNSFKLDQRSLLSNGALLASGSSTAVEFNRAGFIELADTYPDDEIEVLNREDTKTQGIHATISMQHENGKRFSFLNAGFPVNFDGRLECLPTRAIQATHCLLYAAACQVLKQESIGLSRINPRLDNWIYEHALNYL